MTSVDPERDAHLLEIGRAITEWAAVKTIYIRLSY
jgi:hypothetical protein